MLQDVREEKHSFRKGLFFKKLAIKESQVNVQSPLSKIVSDYIEESDVFRGLMLSRMTKHFIKSEILYGYSYFGASIFSNISLNFFKASFSYTLDLDSSVIDKILSSLAFHVFSYFKVQDPYVLDGLEFSFSCDFVRKLFALSEDSSFTTGLECYLDDDIQDISQSVKKIINKFYTSDMRSAIELSGSLLKSQLPPFLHEIFVKHLKRLEKDPILHLKWRIESFVKIATNYKSFDFVINYSNERDKLVNKLLGMLFLLSPEQNFFKMTPVSITSFVKCLNKDDDTIYFIRHLMFEKNSFTRGDLEKVIKLALDCQFVYETRKTSRIRLYGLSQIALLAIKPYLRTIISILR